MSDIVNQLISGMEQGVVSSADLENLSKAMTAGYGGAGKPLDLQQGGVLQAESLETTLKSVTFDMKNLKFWPSVSVDKAFNLFEQYNRIISYGSDSSPYIGEGGSPLEEDSQYVRDGQKIVFFGTRRKVSHQMTLVRTTVGDVVAQQAKEGTMHLLKNIERESYWGNSHFMNKSNGKMSGSNDDLPANTISMNGLLKQLKKGDSDVLHMSGDFEGYGDQSSVFKDLGGIGMLQQDIEDIAVVAMENFGQPNELHAEPAVISSFVKGFYSQFRSAPGLSGQTVGYDVSKITTTAGNIDLKPNLFLRPKGLAKSMNVSDKAPSLGGFTCTAADSGAADGYFAAGSYNIKVTCFNDAGESAPFQILSAPSITLNHAINLTIGTIPAGTKGFKVYMSNVGGAVGTEKFIGSFANVGATSPYKVAGSKKPGLGEAFLLDMSAECMKFKQLAPLSKINFAIVTTALEFAIVLYGALFVYTPRFNGCLENCGK